MELHVSPDSLGSSFRPTQTELCSHEYVINKMQKGQYNNTYFYMVFLLALSFIGLPTPLWNITNILNKLQKLDPGVP